MTVKAIEIEVSWISRFLWIFNTLFHQTLAVVTVFILWIIIYNYELTEEFTWHMILCTFAYIPLMAEGIILFSGDNLWSQYIDRYTKSIIHGVLLFISAIFVSIGNGCILHIHADDDKHFTSIHGWTGLVSWIFVLASQFLGIIAVKPQIFQAILRPVWLKFVHNLLGILGYVFGIVSLVYGLRYRSFGGLVTSDAKSATIYTIEIVVILSLLAATKSAYNQLKDILI